MGAAQFNGSLGREFRNTVLVYHKISMLSLMKYYAETTQISSPNEAFK